MTPTGGVWYTSLAMLKTPQQLINNMIGQLNGVSRMLDEDQECLEVLVQLKAVKSAMNSLSGKLIARDLMKCSAKLKNPKDAEKIKKLLEELTRNS